METQESSKNPSPVTSPNTNGSINTNTNNNNTPPLTPTKPNIPRSENNNINMNTNNNNNNPYPTTFVQADTSNFKQVVQMLTGSTETAKQVSCSSTPTSTASCSSPTPTQRTLTQADPTRNFTIPPIKKQQSFKLYERRNCYNNNNNSNNLKQALMINTRLPYSFSTNNNYYYNNNSTRFSPRNKQPEILSPSLLDFPKLTLSSPVTPLNGDPIFNYSNNTTAINNNNCNSGFCSASTKTEEERAIAEKGFYLHPSPMSTPRDSEPKLLPLFPETSPRLAGSSSSSS